MAESLGFTLYIRSGITRATVREKYRGGQGFLDRLRRLSEDPQHALPDIFIWMISGGRRVAYHRMKARSLLYRWECLRWALKDNLTIRSSIPEEAGSDCGIVQNILLKVLQFLHTHKLSWSQCWLRFPQCQFEVPSISPCVLFHNKKGLQCFQMISTNSSTPISLHHFHNLVEISHGITSSFSTKASLVKPLSSHPVKMLSNRDMLKSLPFCTESPKQHIFHSKVCHFKIHFPVCPVFQVGENLQLRCNPPQIFSEECVTCLVLPKCQLWTRKI